MDKTKIIDLNKLEIEEIGHASQELLDAFRIVHLILVGSAVLQEGTLKDAYFKAGSATDRLAQIVVDQRQSKVR